jgi:hypothetical protein
MPDLPYLIDIKRGILQKTKIIQIEQFTFCNLKLVLIFVLKFRFCRKWQENLKKKFKLRIIRYSSLHDISRTRGKECDWSGRGGRYTICLLAFQQDLIPSYFSPSHLFICPFVNLVYACKLNVRV